MLIPEEKSDTNCSAEFDLHSPVCADAWGLDPAVAMLNHGSFGACPRPILQRQSALRQQMEAEPVRFLVRQMQPLLDQSRQALAKLVGCGAEDLVFVSNATRESTPCSGRCGSSRATNC